MSSLHLLPINDTQVSTGQKPSISINVLYRIAKALGVKACGLIDF